MPVEQFANNAPINTVSASYSNSATSIVMTGISGYPSSAQYRLLNTRTGEVLLVTDASGGTTLVVQRGVENSSAQAINSGDALTHILTGGALIALVSPFQQANVSAAGSITVSGLNLNVDQYYEIEFTGTWNGSFANGTTCVLLPNNAVPANVSGMHHRAYTTGQDMGSTPLSAIELFRSDFSTGGGGIEVWFRCRVRLGQTSRKMFEIDSLFVGSATQLLWSKNFMAWHDTTTNITSLVVVPNAGTLTGTIKTRLVR